jgi:hypothetical protein
LGTLAALSVFANKKIDFIGQEMKITTLLGANLGELVSNVTSLDDLRRAAQENVRALRGEITDT